MSENITRQFPAQTISGGAAVSHCRVRAAPLEQPAPWTGVPNAPDPSAETTLVLLDVDPTVRGKSKSKFQHRTQDLTFRETSGKNKQRKR